MTEDELSHADFINAFLNRSAQPVDSTRSATIMPPNVRAAAGRSPDQPDRPHRRHQLLHPLSGTENPDFGATFASDRDHPRPAGDPDLERAQRQGLAPSRASRPSTSPRSSRAAAASTTSSSPIVSSREVLRIVSSIYGTEAVHYAIFRDSLTGVTAFHSADGKLVVPNLTKDATAHRGHAERCDFLTSACRPAR